MHKESHLAIEGGFNYPDAPGSITLTDTQTTAFETPKELTSYLERLRIVRNILSYGGAVAAIGGGVEIVGGLPVGRFDVALVGFVTMIIGYSSGFRSVYLSSRFRYISNQTNPTPEGLSFS